MGDSYSTDTNLGEICGLSLPSLSGPTDDGLFCRGEGGSGFGINSRSNVFSGWLSSWILIVRDFGTFWPDWELSSPGKLPDLANCCGDLLPLS